jgi:hypothetical protein
MKKLNNVESLSKYLNNINKCERCDGDNEDNMYCVKCYFKKNKIDLREFCSNKNYIEDKNLDKWSDDELYELIDIDLNQYKDYLDNLN